MRIATNIPALQASANLFRTSNKLNLSMSRLSSGVRINSAADDASGLAIANRLRNQVGALQIASRNSLDGISLIQTADGALNEIHGMAQRMRELAVQAANGVYESEDRQKIQLEVNALVQEMDAIVNSTQFNNIKILSGELSRMGFSKQGTDIANFIAKIPYISDTVPSGTLSYQIDKVGTPAQTIGNLSVGTTFSEGSFTINGETVTIDVEDTADIILQKIRDACDIVGINVSIPNYPNPGPLILTSTLSGSIQEVTIETKDGSPLAALGLNDGTSIGTNAEISNVSFSDTNGNPLSSFNNAKSVIYNGNRVEITSSKGQKIYLDLQLIQLDDGSYQLSDGTPVNNDGTLDSGSITGMRVEVMNYGPLLLQIEPNAGMAISIAIPNLSATSLGLNKLNYQTIAGASLAITKMDQAISEISLTRGRLGAYQNRLEYTMASLDNTAINIETARSRIEDTNMAQEMTNYTQLNVLSQAAMSILAQANQRPQQILQILQ